jgi:hypothetical protein
LMEREGLRKGKRDERESQAGYGALKNLRD